MKKIIARIKDKSPDITLYNNSFLGGDTLKIPKGLFFLRLDRDKGAMGLPSIVEALHLG